MAARTCMTGGLASPGSAGVRLLKVSSVDSKPGRGGEGRHTRGVVLHPMLIDGGDCEFHMLGRLGPSAAIHGHQCKL